jgi:hypothetical protein
MGQKLDLVVLALPPDLRATVWRLLWCLAPILAFAMLPILLLPVVEAIGFDFRKLG